MFFVLFYFLLLSSIYVCCYVLFVKRKKTHTLYTYPSPPFPQLIASRHRRRCSLIWKKTKSTDRFEYMYV